MQGCGWDGRYGRVLSGSDGMYLESVFALPSHLFRNTCRRCICRMRGDHDACPTTATFMSAPPAEDMSLPSVSPAEHTWCPCLATAFRVHEKKRVLDDAATEWEPSMFADGTGMTEELTMQTETQPSPSSLPQPSPSLIDERLELQNIRYPVMSHTRSPVPTSSSSHRALQRLTPGSYVYTRQFNEWPYDLTNAPMNALFLQQERHLHLMAQRLAEEARPISRPQLPTPAAVCKKVNNNLGPRWCIGIGGSNACHVRRPRRSTSLWTRVSDIAVSLYLLCSSCLRHRELQQNELARERPAPASVLGGTMEGSTR